MVRGRWLQNFRKCIDTLLEVLFDDELDQDVYNEDWNDDVEKHLSGYTHLAM